MTTLVHDAFVELFRVDGHLLKEMIGKAYGLSELEPRVLTPELTQIPSELRADSVTVFYDKDGAAGFAVVVEVQHTKDVDKQYTWPAYLCATRARHRCPTLLFVLAIDDKIAKLAEASIDLGHPGFCLTPIVITRAQIPHVNDLETARSLPRLAILSALTHRSIEIAATAMDVLKSSSSDYVELYRDLIISAFSEAEQELLEGMMEHYEWKSVRAKRQIAELKEESRKEGIEEGKSLGLEEGKSLGLEEGKSLGRLLALREAVIRIAKGKVGALSTAQEERIRALEGEDQLVQLMDALLAAPSPAQATEALSSP